MLRPREAIALHLRRQGRGRRGQFRFDNQGPGPVIALIDGLPDLETEELAGARVTVRSWVRDPTPDAHATFGASVMVGRIQGLCPGARLLVEVVASGDDPVRPAGIAAAIRWAAQDGARIIAVPLGDHRSHEEVGAAIDEAIRLGATIVAAAGNASPHPILFPARWPGVIAVGACDERGALLEDCCRSPRLDLVLPAHRVVAATGRCREAVRSGTSVATALAGGMLANDSLRTMNNEQPHSLVEEQTHV